MLTPHIERRNGLARPCRRLFARGPRRAVCAARPRTVGIEGCSEFRLLSRGDAERSIHLAPLREPCEPRELLHRRSAVGRRCLVLRGDERAPFTIPSALVVAKLVHGGGGRRRVLVQRLEDEDDGEEEDEEPATVQWSRGQRRRAPRPPQFDELIDDLGVI